MLIRRRVVVSGRVQGVGFRQSCRHEAAQASVSGWVRNRPDGTVEAVLEGESVAVDRVLAWLRIGPRAGLVRHVRVGEEAPQGERGFVVR